MQIRRASDNLHYGHLVCQIRGGEDLVEAQEDVKKTGAMIVLVEREVPRECEGEKEHFTDSGK